DFQTDVLERLTESGIGRDEGGQGVLPLRREVLVAGPNAFGGAPHGRPGGRHHHRHLWRRGSRALAGFLRHRTVLNMLCCTAAFPDNMGWTQFATDSLPYPPYAAALQHRGSVAY